MQLNSGYENRVLLLLAVAGISVSEVVLQWNRRDQIYANVPVNRRGPEPDKPARRAFSSLTLPPYRGSPRYAAV